MGFIKGQALGKLTGCEDDFACLVSPSSGEFLLINRFSPVSLLLKTSMKPLNLLKKYHLKNFKELKSIVQTQTFLTDRIPCSCSSDSWF